MLGFKANIQKLIKQAHLQALQDMAFFWLSAGKVRFCH